MHALKPYPSYRESGVPSFGNVPENWEVRKLRQILRRASNRYRHELSLLSVVREKGVIVRDISNRDENHNVVPDDLTNYKVVEKFQFAMNKMKAWQGSYGVSNHLGIVSPAYYVFDVQGVGVSYFHRAIRSKVYISYFARASDGVRIGQWDLSTSAMREIPFLVPPPSVQASIVRFLDHAERRIRRSIRAKEKLIALLEEQKQVVIHQAVTGRIDVRTGQPYPTYKFSGVEWLGEVPVHWNVKRLRQCGTMVGGMTPSMEEPRFWDGDIPWVTPKDMKREAIYDSGIRVTKTALRETSIRLIEPPAVLMVVRGMILARKVPVAWITNCVTINQDMKAVVPAVGIKAEFLARALDSAQDALATLIDEAGHGTRRLPTERLRTLAVAIPSEDEQSLVVRFADQTTTKIDKRIADARREVDLLREYRTRLIADVVTGKLDVCAAAAALPDEPGDPDAVEADYADPEGGDDSYPDRDRRTEVPTTQREMTS